MHTARVDAVLIRSLEPVLNDLRRTGVGVSFDLAESPVQVAGFASGILRASDASGTGIQVDLDESAGEQVAALANVVQDVVIEDFLLAPWPECPVHRPAGHPLRATVVGRSAVWACPTDNAIIATVGDLPPK